LAASGAITSALRLVTKAAFENSRDGLRKGASMLRQLLINLHLHLFTSSDIFTWATIYAVLFSSISCFFELLCVLLYAFVFPKLPIVKFYRSKAASEGSLTVAADLAAGGVENSQNSMVSFFF